MNKPYYYAHESAYKKIKENGFYGWGNAKSLDELSDPVTMDYLRSKIEKYFSVINNKSALDVGCGTGPSAFLFSKYGLKTSAFDISETAIAMGKNLAKEQNLEINFFTHDIVESEVKDQKFDLIYDSHCYHCIVFDEDRKKFLSHLRLNLAASGIFILDTMAFSLEMRIADHPNLRFDENYILWHKTNSNAGHGVMELDGQHWCAQRRIYPENKIVEEIQASGFKIIEQSATVYGDKEPVTLRFVLQS